VAHQGFCIQGAGAQAVESLFPTHRTILLEGAGHYVQEDAAAEIVPAIRDFVPR
jgi:pimeloyl-ACP methyl ester carboxylesterase